MENYLKVSETSEILDNKPQQYFRGTSFLTKIR